MERNKLIYGLSDAALVVTSAIESGGTWSGATEALAHGRIPVYVRDVNTIAGGNRELLVRGAKPFPPEPWDNLRSFFSPMPSEITLFTPICEPSIRALEPDQAAETTDVVAQPVVPRVKSAEPPSRDAYMIILPALLATLAEPKTEKTIKEVLGLVPAQAKAWLKRACDEGRIRKLVRPVRYVTINESALLFSGAGTGVNPSPNDAPC